MEETTEVVIGPCKCGGYGVCYDEENGKKEGVCHVELKDLLSEVEEEDCANL